MSNYTTNDEPTETKPTNVIKKLRNDKASGADQINAEALKYGGLSAIKWIQRVVFLRLTKLREP